MKGPLLAIFVLDRGFVTVGRAEIDPELAFHWRIVGRTVRHWGTKDGLAELCDGPLPDTVLDRLCVRHTPFRSIIDILEINKKGAERWANHLG
jgi:hypothetical protein